MSPKASSGKLYSEDKKKICGDCWSIKTVVSLRGAGGKCGWTLPALARPAPPLLGASTRRAEMSKCKLCHVRGGNKGKTDRSVIGQDFDWFSYGFVVFKGAGPFFTSAHASPWPTSRIHLIGWKGPPISPHNTLGTPAQRVRCNVYNSCQGFSNLFPTCGGGWRERTSI